MEVIEPALVDLMRADAALHFLMHPIADRRRDRYIAIGRARDPVKPVVEHLDQTGIAKLWMGQRDQIVDNRNDTHPVTLELFGEGEKFACHDESSSTS